MHSYLPNVLPARDEHVEVAADAGGDAFGPGEFEGLVSREWKGKGCSDACVLLPVFIEGIVDCCLAATEVRPI